jgi:hypothetical protein
MRRPCYAHASQDAAVGARAGETVAPVQHASPGDHISCASAVGRTRSATGNATGNEAVASRNKQVARRGRTTACSGTRSALPLCVRRSDHEEPRSVAPRSRTRSRDDRSSHAMVTIMVALSRHLQGVAWHGVPAGSNFSPGPLRRDGGLEIDDQLDNREPLHRQVTCISRNSIGQLAPG